MRNIVSLFSGCGGMDLGFHQAGYKIVWANEIDHYASKVYQHNIGDIVTENIQNISTSDIPSCEGLIAGFPCQPFSSAGVRKGTEDERGNLFLECLRVIKDKNPNFIVFENVRGLLSTKNKDGSLFMDTLEDLLKECDYNVSYKLLNAVEYNVPQKRFRVFILAFKNNLGISYQFPNPISNENDDRLKVKSIIKNICNTPNYSEVLPLSPQAQSLVPYILEGGSWKDIPYEYLPERLKKIRDNMKKYRSPNFYRRFSREEVNGTITATASPEKCGIIHPLEDRRYSVREIARIQSFPDDFDFIGKSIRSKYKMIGNAVPPTLAYTIAVSIDYHLKEKGY